MASRDAFGGFMPATFKTKNNPAVVAVIITPSLIESLMFFYVMLCYVFFILIWCEIALYMKI